MLLKNESLESPAPRLWTVSVTIAALMLVGGVAAVSLVSRAVAEEKTAISQPKEAGTRTTALLKEITADLGKGVKMELVLAPAGKFMMGSPDSDKDAFINEKPQHQVRITKPFYLGKYLVTREQWETVMGRSNSSRGSGRKTQWIWSVGITVKSFSASSTSGGAVRRESSSCLPRRSGNMLAAREARRAFASGTMNRGWLITLGTATIPGECRTRLARRSRTPGGSTTCTGAYLKWCQDWGDDRYYAKSPTDDPTGPATGSYRVGRSGQWYGPAKYCRSAFRSQADPGNRGGGLGFRVALIPVEAVGATRSPSGNDQSAKTSAAKPAAEVSPASDQSSKTPVSTVHVVAEMRTLPRDNYALIGPKYDFGDRNRDAASYVHRKY